MSLAGQVCLVTGATRGIGRGIALQLGQVGATVYITGRTLECKDGSKTCLKATAEEIESRGGRCIPVQCDHANDTDVDQLFERISRDQDGRLDILVNNAYSAVEFIANGIKEKKKFWEHPPEAWDIVNNVGLRNHYRCTVLASRLMVARRSGLIIMISSAGGLQYLFNVPYGVGKAACDRMGTDCAIELKRHNVTCLTLWPGAARTEALLGDIDNMKGSMKRFFKEGGESVEFAGMAIAALAADKNVMAKTGRILMTADLCDEYNFVDIDGGKPWNIRSLSVTAYVSGWTRLSSFIPGWIKVPRFMMALPSKKF